MSYLNYVNEQGGVHGRSIKVLAYDDSYDPPMCLANTQKLIIDDQVFALFCYVGTPTTVKVLPLIEEARIPLLGMFTGANALR
jgi:ABC-type branched-subunit amino acid transport system substrate-binding protein